MIYRIFLILILVSLIIVSCEDQAPKDYIPEIIVEGLLIVDEPIRNIKVIRSQSLLDSFDYDKSLISNAIVTLKTEGKTYQLDFLPSTLGKPGYYLADTSIKVNPEQSYELEVIVDNKVMTGKTFTPKRIEWLRRPKDYTQFPFDSINLPPTDSIEWKNSGKSEFYLIGITCLDSSNYGKYLQTPTNEMNRRIERPFRNDRSYRELTTFNPIPVTSTPIIWAVFKFYGLHQVAIYSPDFNYLRWFAQAQARSQVEPILQSINNGYGFFGSASVIRDTTVLLKNQP